MVHRPPLPPHPAPILRGSTACCAHVDLESANLKIYQVLPFSHAPCRPFPSDILGGGRDGSCMAQTRLSVTPWLCSIPAPGQGVLGGWGGDVGAFLSHPPSPSEGQQTKAENGLLPSPGGRARAASPGAPLEMPLGSPPATFVLGGCRWGRFEPREKSSLQRKAAPSAAPRSALSAP